MTLCSKLMQHLSGSSLFAEVPIYPYSEYQAPRLECVTENYFSYFSTKTYVVGTQKNRLHETVLMSTQNTCLN